MTQIFAQRSPAWRFIKRVLLIGVFAFVVINAFSDSEKPKTLREHWNNSQLTFATLERMAPRCASSEAEFRSCLRAAELVLRFFQIPVGLALESEPFPRIALLGDDQSANPISEQRKDSFFRSGYAKNVDFVEFFRKLHNIVIPSADESLVTGLAINAWLSELDPHSGILPRDYIKEMERPTSQAESNFGIGINFRRIEEKCIVTGVALESPAAQAGILAGDEIVLLNHNKCASYSSFQVTEQMQKNVQADIPIDLRVRRQGKLRDFLLKPRMISTQNLEWRGMEEFGYLRLLNFYQKDACEQVQTAIEKIVRADYQGIILDLRNNPGGYIEEVACIAGLFLGDSVALANFLRLDDKEFMQTGEWLFSDSKLQNLRTEFSDFVLLSNQKQLTLLPLVVLVNHATASSAEILAGALQEYRRALIVGARSFGKGTMQTSVPLEEFPRIQFTQTTHRIRLPSGREIQHWGINPNFPVPEDTSAPRERTVFPSSLAPKEGPGLAVKSALEYKISNCTKRKKKTTVTNALELALDVFRCQIFELSVDSKH